MIDRSENLKMRALYLMAIFFVVDGHIPLVNLMDFGGLYGYYSFHLLLFAFGSGYFFHLYGGVKNDLLTRVRKLLIPLYVWNLVYGILAAVLRRFGGFELGEALSVQTILTAPLTDGEHFRWNLGCWYLFPLFMVQITYAGMDRLLGKRKEGCVSAFLLSLAVGCIAVEICHRERQDLLPLWMLRSMILLPGYAGGVLYRKKLEGRGLPGLTQMALCTAGRCILLLIFGNLSYLLSSCTYFSCNALGVYAGAACAIGFYLSIAEMIGPLLKKSRLMLMMSRNTMDIMIHHYMGFFAVNMVFLLLNWTGHGAAQFSVQAFRTQSGYVYAPGNEAAWDLVYVAAGMTLPLLVSACRMKFRKKTTTNS